MNVARPRFLRSVVVVASGTLVAQGVLALSSPLLTRIYTPAEFGSFAVFSALLGIVVIVASLRYEAAVPLPADDADAIGLTRLSLALTLLAGIAVGAVLALLAENLAIWTGAPALAAYWWLIPIGVVGIGAYQALNMWGVRKSQFGLISSVKVWQAALQVGLQLAGGLMGLGDLGLLGGYIVGRGAGAALLAQRTGLGRLPPQRDWRRVLVRYRAFPVYNAPAALITSAGIELPALLFARYFALDVTGYFSLTLRMLTLPVFLVGQATGQVVYSRAAELGADDGYARRVIGQVATSMMFVGLPLFAFVWMAGPELFSLVFGAEWRPAGEYARLLAPWFCLSLVVTPVTSFALVKDRQRTVLAITVAETAVRLGITVLGGHLLAPHQTVAAYGAAGAIIAAAYLAWVLRLAGTSLLAWLGGMWRFLAVAALCIMASVALPASLSTSLRLASQAGAMAVLAAVPLYLLRRSDG